MSDVHSILYRGPNPLEESHKPKYDPNKLPVRLWPGKAPEGFRNDSDDEDDVVEEEQEVVEVKEDTVIDAPSQHQPEEVVECVVNVEEMYAKPHAVEAEEVVVSTAADMRSRRQRMRDVALEKRKKEEAEIGALQTVPVLPTTSSKRARLREIALAKRRAEEETLRTGQTTTSGGKQVQEESEEESGEGSSESEPTNDAIVLRKPVFMPKNKRATVEERDIRQEEEEIMAQREKQRREQRKVEAKNLVADKLQQEAQEEKEEEMRRVVADIGGIAELSKIDDTDGTNEEEEYELWRQRDLARTKRDAEEREARAKFAEELEQRRNMTEEERKIDDARLDAVNPKLTKGSKYTFMQKYYHPGAFFQDKKFSGEEYLYARDSNLPVGEDAVDKSTLPQVMQLRRGEFGRAGRTKYTHLRDQDTTQLPDSKQRRTKK